MNEQKVHWLPQNWYPGTAYCGVILDNHPVSKRKSNVSCLRCLRGLRYQEKVIKDAASIMVNLYSDDPNNLHSTLITEISNFAIMYKLDLVKLFGIYKNLFEGAMLGQMSLEEDEQQRLTGALKVRMVKVRMMESDVYRELPLVAFYPDFDIDMHFRGYAIVANDPLFAPYSWAVQVDETGKYLRVNELFLMKKDRNTLMKECRNKDPQWIVEDFEVHKVELEGKINWVAPGDKA